MENENFQEFTIRCVNYLNSFIPDFEKCFVTGGFFPRFYHNMPIRDIDVYVGSDDVFVDFVKEYSKTSGFEKVLESKKYFKFFNTQSGVMIDLIGFHNPRNPGFISNFDFSVCRLYSYTSDHKTFISHYQTEDFFDIQKKKIRFSGRSIYRPNGVNHILTRLKKYLHLGFTIDDNELTGIYRCLTGPDAKKYILESGYA